MNDLNGISRFSGVRSRISESMGKPTMRYPSPFFDIGHTYLPPSMKALLKWCRYYYLTNPLINSVIHKMSEYPITETVIDEDDPKVKEKWDQILTSQLRYRAFQIEVGLDYYTYGMCVVTLHFPFDKYLVCQGCGKKHKARSAKTQYKWRNMDYVLDCAKCGRSGAAKVEDHYVRDVKRIRLIRWNPENISVDQPFAGNDPTYTFDVPTQLKNDIMLGKRSVLDTIPDIFIEATKRGKFVGFAPENVFVFKRPIISQKDNGWGMPLILPVLKDTFYLQVLRKAQEMIAQEHIVPLRVLFPQAGSGSADPYTTVSIDNWRQRIEAEIAKWKYDQNYIPILPLPVGNQTIGGDGRALMLHQEMQAWSDQIVAGMGVPREFVFGGLSYSGSNVSMRMLENMFLGYRIDHDNMLNNFVIKRIAHFMGYPPVKAFMRRFKMADDLQRTAFVFQLNQAQKVSDEALLQECDFDLATEEKRKKAELSRQIESMRKMQIAQAGIQGEVMVIQAKYQAEAAQHMPQPQPGAEGAAPGQDPMAGGGMTGQEGEMIDGPQAAPGMPEGSTVSAENAQQAPTEGIPAEMQSPLTMGQKGGGFNLLYLAKQAANTVREQDPAGQQMMLSKMRMENPQLYSLVLRLIQSDKGSQANPLDPLQSPLPEQKPTRRASSVGV